MKKSNPQFTCAICQNYFSVQEVVYGELLHKEIIEEIRNTVPDWSGNQYICQSDLTQMRSRYIQHLLISEKNELTSLEHDVLDSLTKHELLSTNIEKEFDKKWSFGEQLADKIASFGGSWRFMIFFVLFIIIWIFTNSLILWLKPSDPYPYIFLNLLLSCLAAIQAPVIMMSQNRQEAKDRIRSQNDYKINLKAELEIRNLHEKLDHLLSHQWEKMVKIQEIQFEMLTEINKKNKK